LVAVEGFFKGMGLAAGGGVADEPLEAIGLGALEALLNRTGLAAGGGVADEPLEAIRKNIESVFLGGRGGDLGESIGGDGSERVVILADSLLKGCIPSPIGSLMGSFFRPVPFENPAASRCVGSFIGERGVPDRCDVVLEPASHLADVANTEGLFSSSSFLDTAGESRSDIIEGVAETVVEAGDIAR
jgi:hypothetical protein